MRLDRTYNVWSGKQVFKLQQFLNTRRGAAMVFPDKPKGYTVAAKNIIHWAWNVRTAYYCYNINRPNRSADYADIAHIILTRYPETKKALDVLIKDGWICFTPTEHHNE